MRQFSYSSGDTPEWAAVAALYDVVLFGLTIKGGG